MLHPKTTKLSKSNLSNEFIDHTCRQVQLQHHQLEFVKHKENGHENSLTINLLQDPSSETICIFKLLQQESIAIGIHLSTTNNWMLLFYDAGKNTLVSKQSNKFKPGLKLQDQANETAALRLQANKSKRKAKRQGLKETLENEPMHGRYLQRIQQADVDQVNTHQ